ncbi:MAG: hypothetical protein D4R76_10240 [Methylococcus sp.]|nr:MAG: hypothetical protein D4R76_10240 [Methylococcus sp.]
MNQFRTRDFIETQEGLVFAVVDPTMEAGRVLCALRYQRHGGGFRKLSTREAEDLLEREAPGYRFLSRRCAAPLHGVPLEKMVHHHQAKERVKALLNSAPKDPVEAAAIACLTLFAAEGIPLEPLGFSGSLLLGAQGPDSDIDIVTYDRTLFRRLQALLLKAIEDGRMDALDAAAWQDSYARRGCALAFEDYRWHEVRKANKALMMGIKLDITLVDPSSEAPMNGAQKKGVVRIDATVIDAEGGFDTPARFVIDHPKIKEILVFSHTYVGQAKTGETVRVQGQRETDDQGKERLIVGSDREALGEYLMVMDGPSGGCPSTRARPPA